MSVAQVVKKIIEELSDGVSELMLTVIVLTEQNAAIPPELPKTSSAVNETAQMLAKIAKQLAAKNYKKFPPIADKIVNAAVAVDGATQVLAQAISSLQTAANRRAGWEGLTDACRVMAGRTIELLQIVYGADYERIILAASLAQDEIDKIHPADLKNNDKAVADQSGVAATAAAQLAQYIKQRAGEAEDPLAKNELSDVADKLNQQAQDFLGKVNKALENPEDAQASNAVSDAMRGMKKDIDHAIAEVKKHAPEEAPPAPRAHDYSDHIPEEDARQRHPGEDHDSPFKKDLDAARRAIRAVVDAGVRKDTPGVATASGRLKSILDDLLPKVTWRLVLRRRPQDRLPRLLGCHEQELPPLAHLRQGRSCCRRPRLKEEGPRRQRQHPPRHHRRRRKVHAEADSL